MTIILPILITLAPLLGIAFLLAVLSYATASVEREMRGGDE